MLIDKITNLMIVTAHFKEIDTIQSFERPLNTFWWKITAGLNVKDIFKLLQMGLLILSKETNINSFFYMKHYDLPF